MVGIFGEKISKLNFEREEANLNEGKWTSIRAF